MDKKQRYVLNLKLEIEQYQEDILEKRFEIGRKLYNAILGKTLNRYKEMIKTKRWRNNQKQMAEIYKAEKNKTGLSKLLKPFYKIKSEMLKEFRLNEYSLHKDIKLMQHKFKKNIDSFTAQKIASRVWTSLNDNLFGKGQRVSFKSYNKGLNSLEGKSNSTGIRFIEDAKVLTWNKLSMKVQSKLNDYEMMALNDRVCFCRIKRVFIKDRYKYTLQIILEGIPPIKLNKETGKVKNNIGEGSVGLDIGTQTIAIVSDRCVSLNELAPKVSNIESEKYKIHRYMNRSKRANNPYNFSENKIVKSGIKLNWKYSNRYLKAKNKLKNLYRKQKDIRKQDHNIMANKILSQGDTILVETMNFKGLQSRSKLTEKNDKGKFKKKKRFGKSLANKAPSMLLTILENKLINKGGKYLEVNTYKVKASQYNHLNQEYNKKKLSQRWNYFDYEGKRIQVQRDLYSAYLIKNVNDDLETIDDSRCIKYFKQFLKFHDIEIKRVKIFENLSSMGV